MTEKKEECIFVLWDEENPICTHPDLEQEICFHILESGCGCCKHSKYAS